MMKQNHFILKMIMLASLVLLTGCVNLIQEITIQEDGSGFLRFALGVDSAIYPQFQEAIPAGFAFDSLLSSLMLDPAVTDVVQNQYVENGKVWETIQVSISDFPAAFSGGRRIGPATITIVEQDESYRFAQVINMDATTMSIPGVNLLDLTGAGYTVRLDTPQVLSTNGLHTAAGTTTWEVPLSELLQGGATVSLRSDYILMPYEGTFIPWEVFFPYVVIGFLALGGLSILVVILVNTARRSSDALKLQLK